MHRRRRTRTCCPRPHWTPPPELASTTLTGPRLLSLTKCNRQPRSERAQRPRSPPACPHHTSTPVARKESDRWAETSHLPVVRGRWDEPGREEAAGRRLRVPPVP